MALYSKMTKHNKNEIRQGRKLLTPKQREFLKIKNEDGIVAKQDALMKSHEETYLEYLSEKAEKRDD